MSDHCPLGYLFLYVSQHGRITQTKQANKLCELTLRAVKSKFVAHKALNDVVNLNIHMRTCS